MADVNKPLSNLWQNWYMTSMKNEVMIWHPMIQLIRHDNHFKIGIKKLECHCDFSELTVSFLFLIVPNVSSLLLTFIPSYIMSYILFICKTYSGTILRDGDCSKPRESKMWWRRWKEKHVITIQCASWCHRGIHRKCTENSIIIMHLPC